LEELKFNGLKVEVKVANTSDAQTRELEKAIKILKRKVDKDNVLRIVKERRYFTKPSAIEHAKVQKIERRRLLERRKNK
jgi:ribosomal protein S21